MNKQKPAHIERRSKQLTKTSFENVRAVMRADGWSTKDVAEAMGLVERRLYVLLSGRDDPNLATIVQIAVVLGVPETELMREPKRKKLAGQNGKK